MKKIIIQLSSSDKIIPSLQIECMKYVLDALMAEQV